MLTKISNRHDIIMESNNRFKFVSKYSPSGDQPQAIEQLVNGVNLGIDAQTLLWITGSGKTFCSGFGI